MMYGILAEDASDADTLAVLVRRLSGTSVPLKRHGFNGGSELLKKGADKVKLMYQLGERRFIICHDADGVEVEVRKAEIIERVVRPSGIEALYCALVPKEEIESWILADINAVSRVITGFRASQDYPRPEGIRAPKESLEKACRLNMRPRYIHAVHNSKVAAYLDLDILKDKCPSFAPLVALVTKGSSNC